MQFVLLQYFRFRSMSLFFLLFLHAFIGINLFFIGRHYNIDLKSILAQIQLFFVFEDLSNFVSIEINSLESYLICAIYVVTCVIKNIQECYCILFYVISIYGLVKTSKSFSDSCRSKADAKQIFIHYTRIGRLIRFHENFYGCGLLWFLLSGIFCCTFFVVLGDYASNFGAIGITLYKVWLVIFYAIVIGFGIVVMTMVN